MTMADRIRQLRIDAGMTLEEVGAYLGIGRSAVAKYEAGRVTNIPYDTMIKLASLFNVSPSYIMCFDEKGSEGDLSEETAEEHMVSAYGEKVFQLAKVYIKLSAKNREKLLTYGEDLLKAEKFESVESVFKG